MEAISEFYKWAESISDPRVADWFLIPSPLPTYSMSFFYIIFSWKIGPYLMHNREPFNLKYLLIIYNLSMVYLNYHIFKELLFGMLEAGYSYPCQPFLTSTRPVDFRIARALWWYFASKLIEFIDTLFFILRKKDNQISFLHVYHHATMPMLWWIGTKWVPAGQSAPAAIMNAFIHIIMYFYYGMAAFGPSLQKYLWWKRYLTQMQLIQFCIALGTATYSLYSGCDFPRWMSWALILYMISFLVLFGNFYIQAYLTKKKKKNDELRNGKMKTSVKGTSRDNNGELRSRNKISS
ncbi:very long chain fatty acid elongase 4-like [Clytia hemisphaerica]|uniref:Elongation of very long chain fatty acids protein n=1 Tax=Clytia hemisphaerica TaxID=252671 RepID=A0A7M5V2P6_9CNID|eukprot:TCONS_00030252-protein